MLGGNRGTAGEMGRQLLSRPVRVEGVVYGDGSEDGESSHSGTRGDGKRRVDGNEERVVEEWRVWMW